MVKELPTSRSETHRRALPAGTELRGDDPVHLLVQPGGREPGDVGPQSSTHCGAAGAHGVAYLSAIASPGLGHGVPPRDEGRPSREADGRTPREGGADNRGRNRATRRALARRRRPDAAIRLGRGGGAIDREAGMATAEYAIATLAAVGFAALLVAVLSSGEIKGLLMSLITSALNFG